ncbi:MAG: polysaccharide biosynthesis C-terminal domain-containing protein [Bacteroidales bacterium]
MLKQILHTLFSKVALGGFNLLLAVILSQYLGASGKGEQGIILTTISLAVVLAGVLGAGGLTYLAPRFRIHLLYWPSVVFLLFVAIGTWGVLTISNFIPQAYHLPLVVLIVLQGAFSLHQAILQSNRRIQQTNYAALLQIGGTLLGAVVFLFGNIERSVTGYLYSLFVGYSLGFVASFVMSWPLLAGIFVPIRFSHFWVAVRRSFYYGVFNQLDIFTQMISFRFAYYVLLKYEDLSVVGVYSNGVALVEAVWLISRSLAMVQHAHIVNSRIKAYKVQLTLAFAQLAFVLSLLAVALLLLIPSDFYQWLFGPEFGGVREVIASLSLGVVFFSMSFVFSGYFSGVGKHRVNTKASIAGLLVTLTGVWLLIPLWGIWGGGLTASFAYITTTLFKWKQLQKDSQLHLRDLFPGKDFVSRIRGFVDA